MTSAAQRRWLQQALDFAPFGIPPGGKTGGLRHFTTVRLLDRMVESGLMARHPGGNYIITDAGIATLADKRKRTRPTYGRGKNTVWKR